MKPPTAFVPICLSVLAMVPCQSDAAVNLIQNGSFETPDLPTGTHYHLPLGSLGVWQTITDDTFEIWSNPNPGSAAYDGKQHLELQDAPDAVFQTIATTVGQNYSLIFYHSPRPDVDSLLTVALNSITVGTIQQLGSSLTDFAWQEFRTTFVATATFTTLSFTDETTQSDKGSHIDAVQVYAIPEPSAGILLLGTAAVLLRRTRREENPGTLQKRLPGGRFAGFLAYPLAGFGHDLFQRRAKGIRPVDPERQGWDSITRFGPMERGAVEVACRRQRVHGDPGGKSPFLEHIRHFRNHLVRFLAGHSAVSQTLPRG